MSGVSTAELSAPLPEGVCHLLAADSDVASPYRGYVAVCGEHLREAVRWTASESTGAGLSDALRREQQP